MPYLFPGSPFSENMTTATSTASTITRKAWNRFMLPFGGRNPCPSTKAWMTISDDHHIKHVGAQAEHPAVGRDRLEAVGFVVRS